MSDSAELLRDGFMGNVTTLRELQHLAGFGLQEASAACLVAPATFRRWGRDRMPNPTAVRLLAVLAGYVPWPGWEGWEMHNGYLFPPGYSRHGLSPGDILALPFILQLVSEYRCVAAAAQQKLHDSQVQESLKVQRRRWRSL